MNYKTPRKMLLGFLLLASLTAEAQEFDSELHMSTENDVYWYRICSAMPGMEHLAMTDFNGMTPLQVFYTNAFLMQTEESEEHSQWKLTAGEDGKVVITNRATGYQIGNKSNYSDNYNITQLVGTDSPGFNMTALGESAFRIESVEDDGVNRCLAVAEEGGEPIAYPTENENASVIGWKFLPVEIQTGIGSTKCKDVVIRIANKRINVNGTKWQLFNAQGEEMPRTTRLATGVYMVKMPQKTIKVMVP